MPIDQRQISADIRLRALLRAEGLPEPDAVKYGNSCVRFFFHETKTCVVVDLDEAGDDPTSAE